MELLLILGEAVVVEQGLAGQVYPAVVEPSSEIDAKQTALESELRSAGRVLVAFSGGVDSSYLAFAASRLLGDDALAVTALSASYPQAHRAMAEKVSADFQIAHRLVSTHELDVAEYRANAPDRCYHCKT